MAAGHTGIRHVMVSESVVELFGKDTLCFHTYFNQNPAQNVATSDVANQFKNIF